MYITFGQYVEVQPGATSRGTNCMYRWVDVSKIMSTHGNFIL